jgi:HK97 family phage major capsid protein
LTAASANQAGYLVATETRDVIDILRPFSVPARLGMTIETGLIDNQVIPKVTQQTTPQWQNTEAASVTPSTPTLSQIAATPKQVGVVVQYSRQLSLQANADVFVRNELLRTVGMTIDQAAIVGSGASGQPLGLLNTAGVQTQSGTTLNAGCSTMKQKSAEANAADERITFVSTPAVRALLEGRERSTGGGKFVWDADKVADRPAYVSTDMPAATMIAGDWSLIWLGLWGPGFVVEVNPFDPAGFKSGMIQARIIVRCDVAVLHPSAFVVASSIT